VSGAPAAGRRSATAWRGYVGTHVDGALAERVVLPAHNLVRVPPEVGLDQAAIAADALATPYHVFTARAPLLPGQTVAVIGAGGGVGVHMAAMATAFGARVVAIERDPAKEARLCEGEFVAVWNPGDDPGWADALLRQLGGRGGRRLRRPGRFPLDPGQRTAARGPGRDPGDRGLPARRQPGASLTLDPARLLLDEIVVTGSRYASRAEISRTLELVAEGRIEPVIGARYGLEQTAEAYRAMQANEVFGRIVVGL